ncbi:hypothetical protein BTA51_03590 [Hahella sp. CCB-MM4]|nr:hypothetical protein BTA51_03590 [Hahella sp. CCB-MM4]
MDCLKKLINPTLYYSIYSYIPQSISEIRFESTISLSNLTDHWLNNTLSTLENNRELSFHSKVTSEDVTYHIPMIDLGGRSDEIKNLPVLGDLCEYWNINFSVYSSGRSYHCYGDRLISETDWVKFMGSLLLLNIPGKNKIIDNRWVGHRLIGGYSALRWSNNTNHYKKYPILLGKMSDLV